MVTPAIADEPPGGEVHAFAEHQPTLRRRAHRLIGPRLRRLVGASDLMQETLLIAVRRRAEFDGRPPAVVRAWLLRAMRFRLMRLVRDHAGEAVAELDPDDRPGSASAGALSRLLKAELRAELLVEVDRLPEVERAVLLALYREGLPTREVAEALGRTESAVRSIQGRAVRRLRMAMQASLP